MKSRNYLGIPRPAPKTILLRTKLTLITSCDFQLYLPNPNLGGNSQSNSADGFLADAAGQLKHAEAGAGRATRGVGSAPLQAAASSVESIRADLERRESELILREVSAVLSRVLDDAAERHQEQQRAALLSQLQVDPKP